MRIIRSSIILIVLVVLFQADHSAGISANETHAEELVVRIRPFKDKNIAPETKFKYQLLQLALKKTEPTDGPFVIQQPFDEAVKQSRAIALVKKGALDLIATMTTSEREKKLLPVYIPVFKGLLGYRIFIINKRDQEKFSAVKTLGDLKKFVAGQGHDWPDTQILRSNGIPVVTSSNYPGMFSMLQSGRFDYFPRGVHEPWREVKTHKDKGLVVERTLLLQYTSPYYYFVRKDNHQLADRIERGLRLAVKDGSYDHLFYNHPETKNIFESAHIEERRIFSLRNPFLSQETPLSDKELWYHPRNK